MGAGKFRNAVLPTVAILFCLASAAPARGEPSPPAATAKPAAGKDALIGAAVYVSDLPRALKFYRDTLGMRVLMQFNPPGVADKSRPDTVLSFGGGPTDPMLMLLSDRDPKGPRKIEHGFGFARVVLRMADLDGVNARVRAAGFTPGEIHKAHDAFRVLMLTDPEGYTVEIIEG